MAGQFSGRGEHTRAASGWHWHRSSFFLRPGTLPVVILVLVLAAYWAWVTFAPKPPPKPDATWTRILEEGVLRIGIDPSFPPL